MGFGWIKKKRLEKTLEKIIKETGNERIVLTSRIKANSQKLEALQKAYQVGEEDGLEKIFELFNKGFPKEIEEFIYYAVDSTEVTEDLSFIYKMLTCDEFIQILDKYKNDKEKIKRISKLLEKVYYENYTFDDIKKIYHKLL